MWYIMQSIQSKYSLSERLIRTIAAIRSFPHDNVEDLIRKVSPFVLYEISTFPCAVVLTLPSPTCRRELMLTGCTAR